MTDKKNDGSSEFIGLANKLNKEKEKRRKNRNQEILQKMKDGDPLTNFDSMSSWFPPRPTIEKDKKVMEQLYSKKDSPRLSQTLKGEKPAATQSSSQSTKQAKEPNESRSGSKKKEKGSHLREIK